MAEDVFGILGKVIAGTYLVEHVVAEGGFGVVYRAYHRGFRARVALKCLKIPTSLSATQRSRFLEQFRAEAEVLFRLSAVSPTIVRPLHVDSFAQGGRLVPFMALEWLDGWTLDQIIAQRIAQGRPPLGLRKLVRMLTPVARAIEQAHALPGVRSLSVIHRDIKPENLFVAFIGGEQVVKILDFGISKISVGGSWARRGLGGEGQDGLVSFSPAYGAPEQWAPETFGPTGVWTDVWGLALTVVEAVKGREVFTGEPQDLRAAILDPVQRPTPRRHGVRVADEVEAIFERALALDPKSRYPSVRLFWDELLDALDLDAQGQPRWSRRQDPRAEGSVPDGVELQEGSIAPRLTALPPPRWSVSPGRASSPPPPPGALTPKAAREAAAEPSAPRWQPPPEAELEFEPPAAPPGWAPIVAPVVTLDPSGLRPGAVESPEAVLDEPASPARPDGVEGAGAVPLVPALEIPAAPPVPRQSVPPAPTPIELAIDARQAPPPLEPLALSSMATPVPSTVPARRSSMPPAVAATASPERRSSRPPAPADSAWPSDLGRSAGPSTRPSTMPPAGVAPVRAASTTPPERPLTVRPPASTVPVGTTSHSSGSSLPPPALRTSWAPSVPAPRPAAPEGSIRWGLLGIALILLGASVAVAAANQSYAGAAHGESLTLGPLRASWISLGLFLVAVAVAARSLVRRAD